MRNADLRSIDDPSVHNVAFEKNIDYTKINDISPSEEISTSFLMTLPGLQYLQGLLSCDRPIILNSLLAHPLFYSMMFNMTQICLQPDL